MRPSPHLFTPAFLAGVLIAAMSLFASPARAQGFMVMKVECDGILTAGEGTRPELLDYVDLSSIHHDLSVPVSFGVGGQPTTGRPSMDAMRVVKAVSVSSVGMIDAMARGTVCQEILIEHWLLDPMDGQPRVLWQLMLTNALIEGRKEWHAGVDDPPQESFSFFPSQLRWTHFRSNGASTAFSWDFAADSPQ